MSSLCDQCWPGTRPAARCETLALCVALSSPNLRLPSTTLLICLDINSVPRRFAFCDSVVIPRSHLVPDCPWMLSVAWTACRVTSVPKSGAGVGTPLGCGHNWTSHCITEPLSSVGSRSPVSRHVFLEHTGLFPFTKVVFAAGPCSE